MPYEWLPVPIGRWLGETGPCGGRQVTPSREPASSEPGFGRGFDAVISASNGPSAASSA